MNSENIVYEELAGKLCEEFHRKQSAGLLANLEKRNEINVVIKDDGKGFDTGNIREGAFGIVGMKERIDLLKGSIDINSSIGKGTVIMIKVPLLTEEE